VINVLGSNNLDLLSGDYETEKNKYLVRVLGAFKEVTEIENIGVASTREERSFA